MLTQTKQPVPEDYLIVSKIDRMPEPTAFEIESAKKSKEGLELEVHVLAEVVPGPGLMAEVRQVEIILPSPVASQVIVGDPHSWNPSCSAESEPRALLAGELGEVAP